MIRIRYKELSSGLHGKAERSARRTTVYLLPGLTGRQRRAALRRLRQEASRDCGPALPLPQLTVALGLDRTREAVRGTATVVRQHPVATLVPATAAVVLMAFFVLGSVRIVHLPAGGAPAQSPAIGAGPAIQPPAASAPAARLRIGGAGAGHAGGAIARGQRNSAARTAPSAATAGGAGLGSGAPAKTTTGTATPAATAAGSGPVPPAATGSAGSSASSAVSASTSAGAATTAAGAATTAAGSAAPDVMVGVTPLMGLPDPAVCLGLTLLGACLGL